MIDPRRSARATIFAAEDEEDAMIAGKSQAPCLVIGDRATHEAADIMKYFAERTTDIGG